MKIRMLSFLIAVCLLSHNLVAYADDTKRFMKKFMEIAGYYGLSPVFPPLEDLYVGDVFIVSPNITDNKRYTIVYVNSLIDRTSPCAKSFGDCFLVDYKNYQHLRPIVEPRVEEDYEKHSNIISKELDLLKKQGKRKDSRIKERYELIIEDDFQGTEKPDKNIKPTANCTCQEYCKGWPCAKNPCPYIFESKRAAFPSIEINKDNLYWLKSFIVTRILLLVFTLQWYRNHYKLYHFPEVQLVSVPFYKLKCLLPQHIDESRFYSLTGGLNPTEIVNISCGLDDYANKTACKAIMGTRKEKERSSFETLEVEFRIPYVIYYAKSMVIEDTERKSFGLKTKIEARETCDPEGLIVSDSKEGMFLIRSFSVPVAIAQKSIKYTFLFRNTFAGNFNNWSYVGQKNFVH